jgi:hypothetical protein
VPIPPPSVTAPYDTVDSVLNLVRSKMLDTIGSLAGDILQDAQPFMQEYTNAGWRELQFFLATLGHSTFKIPFIGQNYPVVDSTDPSTWVSLSWTQFVNASGAVFAPPTVDVLPQNMILPLRVSERITGSQGRFTPMQMAKDILPEPRKGPYNGWWLWESNTLYMCGAIYPTDLRMELAIYLPDFLTDGTGEWYAKPVPIMRGKTALAYFICDEVVIAREDGDGVAGGTSFRAKAEEAARQIYNIEVSQKQRVPTQRKPYAGRHSGQGYGWQVW